MALFQNAGQVWNHAFFSKSLASTPTAPSEALATAIDRDFGEYAAFAEQLVDVGTKHFGSGCVWLIVDAGGNLSVSATHDATPAWAETNKTPLLVCDLWEHADYID